MREKRYAAAQVIRQLIIGFIHRFEAYGDINKVFLRKMYEAYLIKLAKAKLPTSVLDDVWPSSHPKPCDAVSISVQFLNFKDKTKLYYSKNKAFKSIAKIT